jgi:transposase
VAVLYPDRIIFDEAVPNDLRAFELLDDKLERLADRHRAALIYGVEDHRRYGQALVEVLQARGREVRVVNPLWTHRQKDFYGQDKDDAIDARAIAAVVLRRGDHLPDATEASVLATSLREAERTLQDLAQQRTRALNRLHVQLGDTYLPSYENFFGKLSRPWALRFFARFPVPQDLAGTTPEELAEVLLDLSGGKTGPVAPEERWQRLLERARAILEATAVLQTRPRTLALELKSELIHQLCQELLLNHERGLRLRRLLRDELLPATGQHLQTLPGVGEVLAATILGEVGDIRRFRSPHAFAKYNGTAPAAKSSGGKERHQARRSCNHRLKRAMWLAAFAAVRHDPLAAAHFERCRRRGLTKVEAIKRVARRMSDIVYAMLQEQAPYDRQRVQAAIRARHQATQEPETSGTAA